MIALGRLAPLFGLVVLVWATPARADDLAFNTVKLKDARQTGGEPRITVTPDGRRFVVANQGSAPSNELAYRSTDGGATWQRTESDPVQGQAASSDLDVVATRTNRLIASELDFAAPAVSAVTSYSDDGGKTWSLTTGGSQTGDTDRQWLAVGPDDSETRQPLVYFLYHTFASGTAAHNMFVVTSHDGGATFGTPVPVTQPGTEAYADLGCADSSGPSSISVDPRSGQLYIVWGTRTAALGGGCGASVFGPFEFNAIRTTRVWLATSKDNSPGSWTTRLAVDHGADQRIVGMQFAPGTLDNAGNFYVFYPEAANPDPDFSGAALKYLAFSPALERQIAGPITVAPSEQPGNVLPHVVAGDPGKLDFAYYHSVSRGPSLRPAWYMNVAQTLDGLTASPHVSTQRLSPTVTWTGTANELMGACGSGPEQGVENGLACKRSPDVWGVALDRDCKFMVVWPARDHTAFAEGTDPVTGQPYGPAFDAQPADPGTFVSTQTGGSNLCGSPVATGPGTPPGGVVPSTASGCRDHLAPRSRVSRSSRLTRRGVRLRGNSSDRGCVAHDTARSITGQVTRVSVSIGRVVGRRCRFLRADRHFSTRRSCRRTRYVLARGTTSWSLSERVRLPPGNYQVWVRGVDARNNVERRQRRRNFIRLTVP